MERRKSGSTKLWVPLVVGIGMTVMLGRVWRDTEYLEEFGFPANWEARRKMPNTENEKVITRATSQLTLSADDREHFQQFEKLLDLVRDRTEAVAQQHHNAVLIVGRPGVGKTYTVEHTLRGLKTPWHTWNARMSPMGLWSVMRENPEGVIVIDDLGTLFAASNKSALQVLLAGLGGVPGEPRTVTYATKEDRTSFDFVGGIIGIGNVLPKRDPVVNALLSRAQVVEFEPSDEMVAAFLRSQALRGFKNLSAPDCMQVIEFVIDVSRASNYRLDLRHFHHSLEDFRYWRLGKARSHWKTLIRSGMERLHLQNCPEPVTRAETSARDEQIALDLFRRFPNGKNVAERNAQWKALTNKSPDMLLRHGRTLKAKGLLGRPVA